MRVKCVNASVDGLTQYRHYDVTKIFIRPGGVVLYGMIDDYGQYNEFNANRFIKVSGEVTLLTELDGIEISIKL